MAYDINKWILNERKPVRRRKWVPLAIGVSAGFAVLVGILEGLDGGGADEGDLTGIMPFVVPLVLALLLSPFARDAWVGPREAAFDEFESDAIAQASRRALNITLLAVTLIFAWLWLAATWDWPRPHTPLDWSSLGFALMCSGAALPIMFAEMAVPIPPETEADEEDEQ